MAFIFYIGLKTTIVNKHKPCNALCTMLSTGARLKNNKKHNDCALVDKRLYETLRNYNKT